MLFTLLVCCCYALAAAVFSNVFFLCGVIFADVFMANCLQIASVKVFLKSVNIWQRHGQQFGDTFL